MANSSQTLSTNSAINLHREACEQVRRKNYSAARDLYRQLPSELPAELSPLVRHNRALLDATLGEDAAVAELGEIVASHPEFLAAQENHARLTATRDASSARRIAIVSFLYNWPSTGGGIIHTVELAQFLSRAGYEVRLFYPQYAPWKIGQAENDPFPGECLPFESAEWTLANIQSRFREAVDRFDPEFVLITDSWNIKPYLAEALRGYRILLRLQAMECLCPLNNLRLLADGAGVRQCSKQQLADPDDCRACLRQHGKTSGSLHQWERALCEVESPAYQELLLRSFREAEAVLTLNRATADLIAPFARNVQVVTWGMDPHRFSAPIEQSPRNDKTVFLFAGLLQEFIKGFSILQEACRLLWQTRQDFELAVTGHPPADCPPFLRGVGWQAQADLPRLYRESDVVVVPSLAQEGLSRTAVEAMASGRPVVGSRLGGLAELLEEGVTGLFAEPGDPQSLAACLGKLLEDPALRRRLGQAGRARFERDFMWPTVIERDYVPLLGAPHSRSNSQRNTAVAAPGRRLEIGPGEKPLAGFETLDSTGRATYRARWGEDDLAKELGQEAFAEVYSSHVLEHILWNRTHKALKDVFAILQPGGLFEVWVPDFEYIVACYRRRTCGDAWRRDNPQSDPMLWVNGRIFTYGPTENNLHHACFDYEHLSNCLSQAGFVDIERLSQRTRGTSHGPIDLGLRCRRPVAAGKGQA